MFAYGCVSQVRWVFGRLWQYLQQAHNVNIISLNETSVMTLSEKNGNHLEVELVTDSPVNGCY